MKKSTRQMIKILLEADDTIPLEHREDIWSVVTNLPKPDPSLPLLLSQRQTAELMGVSRHSIRRLVKDGHLRPVKILGSPRYHREDVETLARKGTA